MQHFCKGSVTVAHTLLLDCAGLDQGNGDPCNAGHILLQQCRVQEMGPVSKQAVPTPQMQQLCKGTISKEAMPTPQVQPLSGNNLPSAARLCQSDQGVAEPESAEEQQLLQQGITEEPGTVSKQAVLTPQLQHVSKGAVTIAYPLPLGCAGLIKGMVNQKVLPSPTLDMAPSMPPKTDTCLEQMLRPKPVPPLVLGRFISSSVPYKTIYHCQDL